MPRLHQPRASDARVQGLPPLLQLLQLLQRSVVPLLQAVVAPLPVVPARRGTLLYPCLLAGGHNQGMAIAETVAAAAAEEVEQPLTHY